MEQSQHSSHRLLWAGVGAIVIVILVVAIALLTMMGTKKDTTTPAVADTTPVKVPSKDEVQQNLAKTEASMKQFTTDQATAQAAQTDDKNRIKVGI